MKSNFTILLISLIFCACSNEQKNKIDTNECKSLFINKTDEMTPESINIYSKEIELVSDKNISFKLDIRKINSSEIQNIVFLTFIEQTNSTNELADSIANDLGLATRTGSINNDLVRKIIILFEDDSRYEYEYKGIFPKDLAWNPLIGIEDFTKDEFVVFKTKKIKKIRINGNGNIQDFIVTPENASKIFEAISCLS